MGAWTHLKVSSKRFELDCGPLVLPNLLQDAYEINIDLVVHSVFQSRQGLRETGAHSLTSTVILDRRT